MQRNILLTILMSLLLPMGVQAQRPQWQKMSPLVREACLQTIAGGKPHNYKSAPARAGSPRRVDVRRMIAFVKTYGEPQKAVGAVGGRVLARYGGLCIAELPISGLGSLSRRPDVLRIEAGRGTQTLVDTTALITGAADVRQGRGFGQPYTGRGVVVGVQDIGFDLTHPTFFSADMSRYRIQALWDQLSTDTIGSSFPVGRDYKGREALLNLGCPRDGHVQTHGTHTAGIAAGSGAEGGGKLSPYVGMAPEADLCLVCNATSNDAKLIDAKDHYKYTYAVDALGFKYIMDYAKAQKKPCVINFSEGSMEDFRGDDQLYYEMLDSLTGPGRIIVASAGNNGHLINYVSKPQGVESATMGAYSSGKVMMLTTRSQGSHALRLTLSGDTVATWLCSTADIIASDSLISDTLVVGKDTCRLAVALYADCYDPSYTVVDWTLSSGVNIYRLSPRVEIIGAESDVELYSSSAQLTHVTDNADGVVESHSHGVLSPGSAPGVICVGSTSYRQRYVNWQGELKTFDHGTGGVRTYFSSMGPTYDGRIKPDVMAPGDNVVSAYSSYYLEQNPEAWDIESDVRHFSYNGRTYAWNSNAGTSMSAPVVTGIIALWLQANPRLTPQDCIDIFAKTCTHYDPSLAYPNNQYGYGQIDAKAGLSLAMEKATGIRAVHEAGPDADGRIYTVSGQYAGRDWRSLSPGVYIMNGKKILR